MGFQYLKRQNQGNKFSVDKIGNVKESDMYMLKHSIGGNLYGKDAKALGGGFQLIGVNPKNQDIKAAIGSFSANR